MRMMVILLSEGGMGSGLSFDGGLNAAASDFSPPESEPFDAVGD